MEIKHLCDDCKHIKGNTGDCTAAFDLISLQTEEGIEVVVIKCKNHEPRRDGGQLCLENIG